MHERVKEGAQLSVAEQKVRNSGAGYCGLWIEPERSRIVRQGLVFLVLVNGAARIYPSGAGESDLRRVFLLQRFGLLAFGLFALLHCVRRCLLGQLLLPKCL